ncbi:hypothetical protein ABSA28_00563 [Candidatus Hepatincolaceae symbiont of Richtersius coronifer]
MQLISKETTYHLISSRRELRLIKEGLRLLEVELNEKNYDYIGVDNKICELLLSDISKTLEIQEDR